MIRLDTVLCPIDFSEATQAELDLAVDVCRHFDARLVLEHNVDPRPPSYMAVNWMWSEEAEEEEQKKAAEAERRLAALFEDLPREVACEAKLTRGPVDVSLLYLAGELPADLVVMASHGRSSAEHRSLTERLIVEAPCPVLTVPEGAAAVDLFAAVRDDGVLEAVLPLEFESHSLAAAEYAFGLVDRLPLRLHLLHVESIRRAGKAAEERDRQRLAEMVPEMLASRVEIDVESGRTVEEILEVAERLDASLLVMGTHPKGTLSRMLSGSTAFEILHRSRSPVWFVPAAAGGRVRGAAGDSG